MANTSIDITDLCTLSGIDHQGQIQISHADMTGLEPNPKDDWLYLGLLAIKALAQKKAQGIRSAAFIGSGNGIETIVALKLMNQLETIYVTDLAKNIQPGILRNISTNAPEELKGVRTFALEGRDCGPLPEPVDLIYGNLPLLMSNPQHGPRALALTTLTDPEPYLHLSQGVNDLLSRYSLLSQLGFLLSAKEKLTPNGSIITLIGGRIPSYAISECFTRAGLQAQKLFTSFKRQSDVQFLKEYAQYETTHGMQFAFYDYRAAGELLRNKFGITIPNTISDYDDETLKALLAPALLSANEAYQQSLNGRSVGHIAHAFEAWVPHNRRI